MSVWSPLTLERAWREPDPVSSDREADRLDATDALARAAAGELLTGLDLQAIFGIGSTQYAKLRNRGDFDFLRVRPSIGLRCYSGTLVHRYVTGQPVYEPTFGRKRHRA